MKAPKTIPLRKVRSINPLKEELTPEKLMSSPGMDGLTQQQATEIAISIQTLASILFELSKTLSKNGMQLVDNQENVYLNTDNKNAA